MLHGIIDIGSNTVRMAIYEIEGSHIDMLMKKKHTVGLASYLKDGVMQQPGIDRTVEILQEFRSFLEDFCITKISAFTTAALRNAENSQEAVEEIRRRTGIPLQVISGDEEAEFDFIGATRALAEDSGILVDIGGASTEIVLFAGGSIERKTSLPMGSLMLHSAYSSRILPTAEECGRMRLEAEKILGEIRGFSGAAHSIICGIGGTFKGALALYNAAYSMDPSNVLMELPKLREIIRRFQWNRGIGARETALLMKNVPDRMHTLLPGLVIADVIAGEFSCDSIRYSDSGVREGYIYDRIIGTAVSVLPEESEGR